MLQGIISWWTLATVCAFFIKGLCGFANTLIFQSILSFSENNVSISPVELVLGYPSNMLLAFHERKNIKWKTCLPVSLLIMVGCIPGILFLKNVDTRLIKLGFGVLVFLIGIEMLFRELKQNKMKPSKVLLVVVGILSGILCGLYGIGILLAAYMSRATDNPNELKANLSMVFLCENTIRIILYSITGIVTLGTLWAAIKLLPFMLIGLYSGIFCSRIIDSRKAKFMVIILLMLSGVLLVFNTIR